MACCNNIFDAARCTPECLREVLNQGADVERISEREMLRPIHLAALSYKPKNIEMLLEYGANVNSTASGGDTVLTLNNERTEEWVECVKILLEHGANPNARTIDGGWTPIHLAVLSSYDDDRDREIYEIKSKLVGLLLSYGADPTIKNESGFSAIDFFPELIYDNMLLDIKEPSED